MDAKKIPWDDSKYDWDTVFAGSKHTGDEEDQPGFGFSIKWNKPRQWWKPFVLIQVWHWHVSIGWLL